MFHKPTRQVKVGSVAIGGGAPISIQSMANTLTTDVRATVDQIKRLAAAGCDIVRVGVPDEASARVLGKIVRAISLPLVADIHFDPSLALIALEEGVHKLRINPGNIGSRAHVEKIAEAAKKRNVPIRIGVNAGSLEKDLLKKYGHPTAKALVESAKRPVRILEKLNFHNIVLSLKASDVQTTIEAYRLASRQFDYPLHLGVTEAGTLVRGAVQSAAALSILLNEGIGDTVRISLTADPVEEVRVAKILLESLGLRPSGARIISCPTCARAEIDVIQIANEVERRAQSLKQPFSISVMGCLVNGPGELLESDFGICGGRHKGAVYVKGKPVKTVPEAQLVDVLFQEIAKRTAPLS